REAGGQSVSGCAGGGVRGRRFAAGLGGRQSRPSAHAAGHRTAAAEDPETHGAAAHRAGGPRRECGRIPQAGQQCQRQTAEQPHQT
ncbi:hypothetical protein M9458_017301, partial [Cirrhinus mrigala]